MACVNQSYSGRGIIYIDGRDIGNTESATVSFTEEKISIKNFRTSAGGTYASATRIDETEATFVISDYNKENLALALYGTDGTTTGAVQTDESITVPSTLGTCDLLVPTTYLIDTAQSVVVTSDPAGTTYTVDVDYELSSAGIIILASGSISASDPLLVDYTSLSTHNVEAITGLSAQHEVVFAGVDAAQGDKPFRVTIYKWKPGPGEGLELIPDEFGNISITGAMEADSTKTGVGISQYMKREAVPAT